MFGVFGVQPRYIYSGRTRNPPREAGGFAPGLAGRTAQKHQAGPRGMLSIARSNAGILEPETILEWPPASGLSSNLARSPILNVPLDVVFFAGPRVDGQLRATPGEPPSDSGTNTFGN